MKNWILCCLLATTLPTWATETILSTIEKATVFPNGATVHRIGEVAVATGTSTLLIDELPLGIDEATITIQLPKGVLLLSHKLRQEFLDLGKIETSRFLQKQKITDSLTYLDLQITTLQGQEHILNENRKLTGTENSTFTTAELRQLNAFYGQEMLAIKKQLFNLGLQKRKVQEQLNAITAQAKEDGQKAKKGKGQLVLEISSERNQVISILFSYFTSKAGWTPNYDLRVEGIQKDIQIVYKAAIFQNTGEDWDNIQLALSNAEPLVDYSLPELKPYYLNFNNYYQSNKTNFSAINGLIRGTIIDENGESLIGANVMIKGTNIGTTTDLDGNFSINVPDGYKFLTINYTGYTSKTIPIDGRNLLATLESGMLLDEVVVTGYGSRTNRDYAKKEKAEQAVVPTSLIRSQTSFVYEIDLPYSIPSTSNQKAVLIKTESVAATFEYITMPKITETAFLTAKIADWHRLNLLPGAANIFLDNKYAGKTFLENNPLEENYTLSLGKDDEVIVQRTLQTDY